MKFPPLLSDRSGPARSHGAPDRRTGVTWHIRELPGTPDLLRLHALSPQRYPCLLESAGSAGESARFDILLAFPGESLVLDADWRLQGPGSRHGQHDFLDGLDRWWDEHRQPWQSDPCLPFRGGWFVFMAYELARQIEPRLTLRADPGCPVAIATRTPAAIICDRHTGSHFALAEEEQPELLQAMLADLRALRSDQSPETLVAQEPARISRLDEDDPRAFLAAIARAKAYIAAGDIYQANISRSWHAEFATAVAPWRLYQSLRLTNPSPFAGIATLGGMTVISSSPERLLKVSNGRVQTRPIAGTRPRLANGQDDLARRCELIASPKERAEHVMLIDLERNDLGRICRAGSVRVDELMTIESYAHVHHIVSNVSGELRPASSPGKVLRAVFPGGTITGCPKVRCMSIIHELETRPRGAYCGTFGYLNRDGSCDFNILIRTMTLSGRILRIDAGSGIVADSDPQRELEETRAKARGVLLSLENLAGRGADLAG
jgi:anthranilate synthase component 1